MRLQRGGFRLEFGGELLHCSTCGPVYACAPSEQVVVAMDSLLCLQG